MQIEIHGGMRRQCEQTCRRAEKEGEAVAEAVAEILFNAANMVPRPPQTGTKQSHPGNGDEAAGRAPVGEQVQVIVMRAVGLPLHMLGAIGGRAVVVMRRT